MQKIDNTYQTGQQFEIIYEQMLQMENLKLIIIDPMASFVHADVNADPAAGAAFMGLLAQMATETGATVIVNHHMAKIKDDAPITTPEQARNLIRGTSAIVDGVRCAFSVWQVGETVGKQRCQQLGVTYTRNAVFDGAVVKSNGPANRDIRNFIRNSKTGLLEDRSVDLQVAAFSSTFQDRLDRVYAFIAERESIGNPLSKRGKDDGIYAQIKIASQDDMIAQNVKILDVSESTIRDDVNKLMMLGRVGGYRITRSGDKKFLGIVGGTLEKNEPTID